ncbi:MAG: HGGxSTG domain-containing protein [Bryobacteraceae bacterium]
MSGNGRSTAPSQSYAINAAYAVIRVVRHERRSQVRHRRDRGQPKRCEPMTPDEAGKPMAPGNRRQNLTEPTADAMQSGERGAHRFGRLRNGNPPGDPRTAPKCLAKTRSGLPCQAPAMRNPTSGKQLRCRMHGGCSTGPRTSEGKERVRMAHWRHGERSAETIAKRRAFRSMIRLYRLELDILEREIKAFLRTQKTQAREDSQPVVTFLACL